MHLEAKLLETATQKRRLKLELYRSTLRVNLNCVEMGTFGLLKQAQHLTPAAVLGYRCMLSLWGIS